LLALKPRRSLSVRALRYGVVGMLAFAIDYGVTAIAFTLTVLATIYPAIRGAATEPAEALRYE